MDKKPIPYKVKEEVNSYLKTLGKLTIPIKKVYLFGSYAKGTFHKYSDVDICVVSPYFDNATLQDMSILWHTGQKYNSDLPTIEAHGFGVKEFKDRYSSIVYEIKQTGIKLKLESALKGKDAFPKKRKSPVKN